LRNCAQAHAIALADQGESMKQCEIGDFHATQWNEKILGKFKKSFLLTFLLKKVRRKTLTSLLLRRISR
jgi:hypothetical protein